MLTPDEVRMLDNRYSLLFIRGELPVMDDKIDLLKHPDVGLTTDGAAQPFRHGAVIESTAAIVFDDEIDPLSLPELAHTDGDYELLSEEDLEEQFSQYEEDFQK
jgi:type IV secretion system protein VirD4